MDLAEFDLNLLVTFDAIHRHQNLSATAAELGLTQPAISAALKRLRGYFDDPLFVRTSHGMRPTPYADDLAPKIRRTLDALRGLRRPARFDPRRTDVHFRIYINDVGMMVLMPRVVQRLEAEAPGARLSIVDLRPDEVIDALDDGKIDLAVGYFLGMPNWAHQQTVRDTSYVCLVRADHPLVGRELTLERFLQLRHAMYWTTGSQYRAVEHALATLNLSHDVMLRAPRFSALPFLIARSDLVVTVPEDLGVAFARLLPVKVFEPPLPLGSFQIKQYWHARLHAEPAHRWLRKLVREETAKLVRRQPAGAAALPPSPQNPATRPSRRGSLAQT